MVPSYEQVKPFVNEALDYCLSNDIFPYIEALPFCVLNKGRNRSICLNSCESEILMWWGIVEKRMEILITPSCLMKVTGNIPLVNNVLIPHNAKVFGKNI